MSESFIEITNVGKNFSGYQAVDQVSISLAKGEFLALLGKSGCGQTTLLRLLAGFEKPDGGSIRVAGKTFFDTNSILPPEKRSLGLVFQDYAIFPHMSVAQNIVYGVRKGQDKDAKLQQVLKIFELEGQENKMPHQLSGGQQQRVAIARALASGPDVLLLDEPFSNLDSFLRRDVRIQLHEILKKTGITTILVTHDQEEAFSWADRVAIMKDGRVLQCAAPSEVYLEPACRQVAAFVGDTDFITGEANGREVECLFGRLQLKQEMNGSVDIMMRPENIRLELSEEGAAEIISSTFYGRYHIVEVRQEDIILKVEVPSREVLQVGKKANLSYPYPCTAFAR
jgi:iron(III) transport system ATP-binding protein